MHVASPLTDKAPDDENEIIKPAKEGLLRALKSSIKNKIKRFVMTSSFSAVGYGNEEKIYNESKKSGINYLKINTNEDYIPSLIKLFRTRNRYN